MRRLIVAVFMAALSLAVAFVVVRENQPDIASPRVSAMATVMERTIQQQEAMKIEMDALAARQQEILMIAEEIAEITAEFTSRGLPGYLGTVVVSAARRHNIADPLWIVAVIAHESLWNPRAVNENRRTLETDEGEFVEVVVSVDRGLMQINSGTAPDLARKEGIKNFNFDMLFDPEINIKLGTRYLGEMLQLHRGDLEKALGSYNKGPTGFAEHMHYHKTSSTPYSQKVLAQLDLLGR